MRKKVSGIGRTSSPRLTSSLAIEGLKSLRRATALNTGRSISIALTPNPAMATMLSISEDPVEIDLSESDDVGQLVTLTSNQGSPGSRSNERGAKQKWAAVPQKASSSSRHAAALALHTQPQRPQIQPRSALKSIDQNIKPRPDQPLGTSRAIDGVGSRSAGSSCTSQGPFKSSTDRCAFFEPARRVRFALLPPLCLFARCCAFLAVSFIDRLIPLP